MILVTGGGGFLGTAVCAALAGRGLDVLASDRTFARPPEWPYLVGDLTDPGFLSVLFESQGVDDVVHLAGLLNTASRLRPEEALRVNVGASLALLERARRAGVETFVFGSSISAYGSKRFAEFGRVAETVPASPDDVYGVAKRYVEVAGEAHRRAGGVGFVALRIAMVVGAGAGETASPWRSRLFEALGGDAPATIDIPYAEDEVIPLVHVDDVAEAIGGLLAVAPAAHTLYNGPAESWRGGDLAEYVGGLRREVTVTCGRARVEGIPQAIDDGRLAGELGLTPLPLRERLARAALSAR
jgi:nucleoside-diphosphate-sugar epimerase